MLARYQTETMRDLWSDENKFKTWYHVEIAYLEALLHHTKKTDPALIARLKSHVFDWPRFVDNVAKIDAVVHHDVIAFLQALEEELGEDARLIHAGLTSSDVVDTGFALHLRDAGFLIQRELHRLVMTLWNKAQEYRGVRCLGRTHGQAAEGFTFGIKLLGFACELARGYRRLRHAIADVAVGKLSGAVGVYSQTHPEIEAHAMHALGLTSETVATQVVARDRHAQFFTTLAVLGGSIERLAVEIRLLMHGQVKEVAEPFQKKQKGSSAMPHKKNPVLSENLTGLMRLMRSYALGSLENQALWHERDISHSSVERVIAPDATSIMEFALRRMNGIMSGLIVDEERMAANLDEYGDLLASQSIMLALVDKGVMRKAAYELVQSASFACNGDLRRELAKAGIAEFLSEQELDDVFAKSNVVHYENAIFERARAVIEGCQ